MKSNKYIDEYIEAVESSEVLVNKDIKEVIVLIKEKLSQDDVWIDSDKIDLAIEKIHSYFPYELFDWQKFVVALVHCYYNDGTVVWDQFLLLMGRGAGKNGFISALAWYLTTGFHGIKEYNIDIVANSEQQAKTSFMDIYNVIDNNTKLQKAFKCTKEEIIFKKTKSYIRYNTSNAKTKDGLRSAAVIFDEIHCYENYEQVKVFRSGLGKKVNSRTFYITTNGNVRGGVLDDYLEKSKKILSGEDKKSRMLPLLYRLDDKSEVDNFENWYKANPSLKFFSTLRVQMEQEYEDMKTQQQMEIEFMTKRMNIPAQDNMLEVAPWEKILATNQPIPDIAGLSCIGGVDFSLTTDFTGVGLLFKYGEKRVWIHHTFICHKALEMKSRQFKFPIDKAVEQGLATIVYEDDVEPSYVVNWFLEKRKLYNIIEVEVDSFRRSVLSKEFQTAGIPLKVVRNGYITHTKIAPLVERLFAREQLIFGDDMMMRWYTNNVYKDTTAGGKGKGNIAYLKKEEILRKTDGFFAFIHALSEEDKIPEQAKPMFFPCYSY